MTARSNDIPVPDWVVSYFDNVSNSIWDLQQRVLGGEKIANTSVAIAEAMQMKKPGRHGRGNVFSEFNDTAWIFYGDTVHRYMRIEQRQYDSAKLDGIIFDVALRNSVSESTIWRSLEKYEARCIAPEDRLYKKK